MSEITRDEAFALLKKYNKDPFHIQHALTVEAVMNGMQESLAMGQKRSTGVLSDCCMTLILSCIRQSTA